MEKVFKCPCFFVWWQSTQCCMTHVFQYLINATALHVINLKQIYHTLTEKVLHLFVIVDSKFKCLINFKSQTSNQTPWASLLIKLLDVESITTNLKLQNSSKCFGLWPSFKVMAIIVAGLNRIT